jgi:hypothetical protein
MRRIFFPKTQESCASLHYRERKKDIHTSTPLIRGSDMREGGVYITGTSLKERKKNSMTSPRPKLTQIVPLRPRFCNFLAPAKHQRLCSSFSSCSIELTEGEAPSNTQAFLCFQITQAPNMIMRRINRYFALPLSYSAKMVHFQCVL